MQDETRYTHGATRGKCHKLFSVFTNNICVSANYSSAEGTCKEQKKGWMRSGSWVKSFHF